MDSIDPTVIIRTVELAHDATVLKLAHQRELEVVSAAWEDTARDPDSPFGPNITDLTIQVMPAEDATLCLPVIRKPNFVDLTGQISPELFFLLVGNQQGEPLRKVTLREVLTNLREYLHDPGCWWSDEPGLFAAERDERVLVSAQACFLPVPPQGLATFYPVVFNFQSEEGDPAVLTLLATREGTSITIIDNVRDRVPIEGHFGQRLYFNENGRRCALTAQRESDFRAENQLGDSEQTSGLSMALLIQVPLLQQTSHAIETDPVDKDVPRVFSGGGDMEAAILGHGEGEGPFTEIDGLEIKRDERYPVRVTVQFYKATSDGIVTAEDMDTIQSQIERVYADADFVGSLVVS